ncbi:DinB family protein [Deinococcus sp. UYEF24]
MGHADMKQDGQEDGAARHELLALLDYAAWATERVLNALTPLTPEELARDLGSSHGGIAGTLEHLYGSDVIWTARLCSRPAVRFDDLPALPPLELLGPQWLALQTGRRDFVAGLESGRVIQYANLKGETQRSTVGEMVRHVVNHATHHRGQIVSMLRQLGYPAPNTDLIAFYRSQAK